MKLTFRTCVLCHSWWDTEFRPPPPMAQQPLVGQGLLIIEALRSHSDTPHSVGLLWTSDQPIAETSAWQHTTLTRHRHPCLRRDSNPQSQQAQRLQTHALDRMVTGIGGVYTYHLDSCRGSRGKRHILRHATVQPRLEQNKHSTQVIKENYKNHENTFHTFRMKTFMCYS
jgi:hypothetical protein